MTNILYVDDRHESSELIELLDKTNITYELCSECEARRNGYKSLPVLVIGDKAFEFKKAKRYVEQRVIKGE